MIAVYLLVVTSLANGAGPVSGPRATFARGVEHQSGRAEPLVGDSSGTHVEAIPVVWVGIEAIWFSTAEARSRDVGGSGGGGGIPGFRCGGRGQWR